MQHSVDFEALSALERAAGPVWAMMDYFTALFAEYENSDEGVAIRLEAMQKSYASSLQLLHRLQIFEKTMHDRIEQFTRTTERSGSYISRTSMGYGNNLLPDDVLSVISVLAATDLEEKVALSLVCKRFRRVMMSMRKMWDGYWIESNQPPEQIVAIGEGNRLVSLKAHIHSPSPPPSYVKTWVANRRLDLEEYSPRYHKFSVGLIMSLNPEELKLDRLTDWEDIEQILGDANVQNLRSLWIESDEEDNRNSPSARLLERWRMPHLRNLAIGFVPGAALVRSLVWCKLEEIDEAQFDALREFLCAAKSLQHLVLSLSQGTRRFYEVCNIPSLRSLKVDFVPHPSLAKRLVRFDLYAYWYQDLSLSELIGFLSSSNAVEELAIGWECSFSEDPGTIDALSAVTMPSAFAYDFRSWGSALIAKLPAPTLRTLSVYLHQADCMPSKTRDEFRTSLRSMTSLQELELNYRTRISHLDEVVRYAPPHLESFSLKECECVATGRECWDTSPAPNRKLVHFSGCVDFDPRFMPTFVDYLGTVGLGGVKLRFSNCKGWRNRTFGLDDVMSASQG